MKSTVITAAVLFTATGSQAKKSYDYRYYCPIGYDLDSHHYRCTKQIKTSSDTGCPHGHDLTSENQCVKFDIVPLERVKEYKDLIHACPPGYYEHSHHRCRKEIRHKNDFYCPSGYDDIDIAARKCKRISTSPPSKRCPEGAVEEHGKCLKKETQPLQDGGFKEEKIGVEWRCPENLPINPSDPDRCLRKKYFADPEQICESQTLDNGHACGWVEKKPKEVVCPAGYYLSGLHAADGGQLCERCGNKGHKETSGCEYVSAKRGCKDGFYNTGHECEKTHHQDFKYVCPQGGHVDRHPDGAVKCTSSETVDKFKYCPEGFHRQGKECVRRVPVSGSCPPGFEQFVMLCKKIFRVDFELFCRSGNLRDGVCFSKDESIDAVYSKCPRKTKHDGEFCVSFDYKRKDSHCPAGYQAGKGKCYKIGNGKCPSGYEQLVRNGDRVCVMKSVSELVEKCPRGFHPAGPGQCSRVDEIDAMKEYVKDTESRGHHSHGHH